MVQMKLAVSLEFHSKCFCKKESFRVDLKDSKLFHNTGAAFEKALSSYVERLVLGMVSKWLAEDLKVRTGW